MWFKDEVARGAVDLIGYIYIYRMNVSESERVYKSERGQYTEQLSSLMGNPELCSKSFFNRARVSLLAYHAYINVYSLSFEQIILQLKYNVITQLDFVQKGLFLFITSINEWLPYIFPFYPILHSELSGKMHTYIYIYVYIYIHSSTDIIYVLFQVLIHSI